MSPEGRGEEAPGSDLTLFEQVARAIDDYILVVDLVTEPYVPAFVTRRRYARFVPYVSRSVQMLGCPVIDPRRDARGALEVIAQKARTLEHGLVIFPEGHRSLDGEVRPFRVAGTVACLEARRVPLPRLAPEISAPAAAVPPWVMLAP